MVVKSIGLLCFSSEEQVQSSFRCILLPKAMQSHHYKLLRQTMMNGLGLLKHD